MPATLAEQVDQVTHRLERSRGWTVKQALNTYLAQEKEGDRQAVVRDPVAPRCMRRWSFRRSNWTCNGFVPVCGLFYAALASKARGLILPR